MEERKYNFFDKFQRVRYQNVTEKELKVLNQEYSKERYLSYDQYIRQNTVLFCAFGEEEAEEIISDRRVDVESEVINDIFFKGIFSELDEKEKIVVYDYFVCDRKLGDIAKHMKMSYRQVSRYKNKALEKMLKALNLAGYKTYAEAAEDLLNNQHYIPTQMEAQSSIKRRRKGPARMPSDSSKAE